MQCKAYSGPCSVYTPCLQRSGHQLQGGLHAIALVLLGLGVSLAFWIDPGGRNEQF